MATRAAALHWRERSGSSCNSREISFQNLQEASGTRTCSALIYVKAIDFSESNPQMKMNEPAGYTFRSDAINSCAVSALFDHDRR
jgi:hypothetical protein